MESFDSKEGLEEKAVIVMEPWKKYRDEVNKSSLKNSKGRRKGG